MQIWIIPHEVIWIVTGQYPYSIPTSILTCSKKLTVFFPFFLSFSVIFREKNVLLGLKFSSFKLLRQMSTWTIRHLVSKDTASQGITMETTKDMGYEDEQLWVNFFSGLWHFGSLIHMLRCLLEEMLSETQKNLSWFIME